MLLTVHDFMCGDRMSKLVSSNRPQPGLISVKFHWKLKECQKILKSFVVKGGLLKHVLRGKVSWISRNILLLDFDLWQQVNTTSKENAHQQSQANNFSNEERPLTVWISFSNDSNLYYFYESKDAIYSRRAITYEFEETTEVTLKFSVNLDFGSDITSFDTVIAVTGSKNISVCAASLCKSSPVFEAMFNHEMEESLTKQITIKDIDYDTLKILLLYIYRGHIIPCIFEVSFETYCSLYSAADKYDIPPLKKECLKHLRNCITKDNIIEILAWAHFHSVTMLYQAAFNYVADNARAVCSLPEWKELITHLPHLAVEADKEVARRRGVSDMEFS